MNNKYRQNLRRCLIHGKDDAYFHCWEHMTEVIRPSPLKGGHPGGVVSGVMAIVEDEEGIVHRVRPEDLAFTET